MIRRAPGTRASGPAALPRRGGAFRCHFPRAAACAAPASVTSRKIWSASGTVWATERLIRTATSSTSSLSRPGPRSIRAATRVESRPSCTDHGGAVLGDHRTQGGVAHPVRAAALPAHLVQRPEQGCSLGEQGDSQDRQSGHIAVEGLLGAVPQRFDALEEGEAAAHHEDADGREQRPEEPFLAVAEGGSVVGGAAAAAQRGAARRDTSFMLSATE
jgi:hypothetical protein